MTARKTLPIEDPAGLDKLLLAAGKGVARFLENAVQQRFGVPVTLWDGTDGLGAVLEEHLKSAGVPNKRLPDILTPRSVLEFTRSKKVRRVARRQRKVVG